jgi:hypothetical protein
MALLGVILLLAGIGAGVFAYVGTHAATGTTTVTAFGFSREATPLELVAYGAIAMLLFALGWALLSASARHRGRVRREAREGTHVAELEERAETQRLDYDRRLEEAGLRDEDLRRRESQLAARHEGLDQREAELARRESGMPQSAPVHEDAWVREEARMHDGIVTDDGSAMRDADRPQGADADGPRDADDDRRTKWVDEAPPEAGSSTEPPARPAETRGRPHETPRQNV